MPESQYACPECEGVGSVDCHHCGSEMECDNCDATGFDPALIDVTAYALACARLPLPSWDWYSEGGASGDFLGRINGAGQTVRLTDYLRGGKA